jgi:CRP-like cAMP-binding protein
VYSGSDSLARERHKDSVRAAAKAESGIARALENASIFNLCSKREVKLVAKLAKVRSVPAGTTLMTQGEAGDTMIVFLSGGAEVKQNGKKLADLGSGEVAGEMAVLGKAPRNATVTTRSDSEIAVIGRRELYRLIEDAPGFSRKLLEALANRVREMDRRAVC